MRILFFFCFSIVLYSCSNESGSTSVESGEKGFVPATKQSEAISKAINNVARLDSTYVLAIKESKTNNLLDERSLEKLTVGYEDIKAIRAELERPSSAAVSSTNELGQSSSTERLVLLNNILAQYEKSLNEIMPKTKE
jgi:hypothetical protein